MSIAIEIQGSIATIILSKGIDYGSQDDFKNANQRALTAEGVNEIHVDFAQATFLDSAGIRSLVDLQRRAAEAGKPMIIMNCNENIRDIFEIGGFDTIFNFQ